MAKSGSAGGVRLRVKRLHPEAILPVYATAGAACLDLFVDGSSWPSGDREYGCEVHHGKAVAFATGLAFEVPEGHVLLVFSRSGHGFKHGVRLANCVGVIDSDYRGEVCVKLTAEVGGRLMVNVGDRIAQALLVPLPAVTLEEVGELSETVRGTGGLGSTGS